MLYKIVDVFTRVWPRNVMVTDLASSRFIAIISDAGQKLLMVFGPKVVATFASHAPFSRLIAYEVDCGLPK